MTLIHKKKIQGFKDMVTIYQKYLFFEFCGKLILSDDISDSRITYHPRTFRKVFTYSLIEK